MRISPLCLSVVVVCSFVMLIAMLNYFGSAPPLGVQNERLAPCPDRPNCVSSFATDERHCIAPVAFRGDGDAVMERIAALIRQQPRARISRRGKRYLHAVFISRWLRFRDDVEFLVDDETQLIHWRSASRIGRSDLGVNRRRLESLRQQLGEV